MLMVKISSENGTLEYNATIALETGFKVIHLLEQFTNHPKDIPLPEAQSPGGRLAWIETDAKDVVPQPEESMIEKLSRILKDGTQTVPALMDVSGLTFKQVKNTLYQNKKVFKTAGKNLWGLK